MSCQNQFKILNKEWKSILKHKKLNDFEAIWAIECPPFEPINERRGGYSGVYRIQLEEVETPIFLKRQKKHNTRIRLKKVPTFYREYLMLRYLSESKVPVAQWIAFGCASEQRAFLMVEELRGYHSFDLINFAKQSNQDKQTILKSIALTLSQLHQLNIRHGSCYPKHLFLKKEEKGYSCKLIDLEKASRVIFQKNAVITDLDQFIRHDSQMNSEEIAILLKQYCQLMGQQWQYETLFKQMQKRAQKKSA